MQKKRNLLLAAGTVVATLIGGLLLPLTPIASAQTNLPLSYAAKFVCGEQSQNLDPRFPVARGFYATEINIYNQNKSEAKLEKQVLVLFDDTQPLGREPDQVPPTGFDGIALQPGQSTMDDCFGIRRILGMNPNATTLLIGFFTIRSITTPITVDAVYTTGATAGARLAVPAITVEHIQPVTVNP